jgi:DnaK suppressor protein
MLTKLFTEQIKKKLLSDQEEILQRVSHRADVDTDGDEGDEIQGNMIIEMQNQLNSRDRDKLSKITEALSRIDTQEYGICEDCGEEISEKRLNINPHFITCILCAETREIEQKQKRRV